MLEFLITGAVSWIVLRTVRNIVAWPLQFLYFMYPKEERLPRAQEAVGMTSCVLFAAFCMVGIYVILAYTPVGPKLVQMASGLVSIPKLFFMLLKEV